ncbi:MAG: OmcA/MtrC family decaheme c-type cytochrome [Chloroflexi bacterium]|nr:OmcA/MtrC family decaheme c-type cytochrome [Chloroflexota bacterium]
MAVFTRRTAVFGAILGVSILAAVVMVIAQSSAVATGAANPAGDGVVLKITGISIPDDLKPVVSFTVTDAKGSPLSLADFDEGGLRFILAAIKTDPETQSTMYVNYVVNNVPGRDYRFGGQALKATLASAQQAGVDSTGTFSELGGGSFTYKFGTALPSDFDRSATHALGGYVTRNARAFVSNDVFYFVPSGGPVQVQRQIVTIEACNACHDNLAFHGGTRKDTRVCVLCHTPQTTDPETSNPVDFKVLIHKIHSGHNLPSVEEGTPYYIVGNSQNVFDFSGVRWPQDTRNCQTCHKGPQGDNFKTQPSARTCGSCHDNVNFTTGANHPGGPQPNSACKTCHTPDGPEFGLSVTGAHTIPTKSTQLRGVNFEIVSFTNTRPGESPTVVFNIKDNAGQPIAPSEMTSVGFVLSGPTTDYTSPPVVEAANNATPTGDGNYSYTFNAKIPADASGTYAVGIQGYIDTPLKDPSGNPVDINGPLAPARDVGFNRVAYGAVTDAVPMPRKQIVDINNCNKCHETLALHGGTRRNTEFCILCHNPMNTDIGKRTTAGGPLPPESIQFTRLIHKIHTGEEQSEKPYIIYGGAPANPGPIDLSEAQFPTDRRNCEKCHIPGGNLLSNMRKDVLPVTVKVGDTVFSSTPPIQNACTACHDSKPAIAHTQAQTVNGVESCLVCHNENREFPVSKAHAR